MEKIAGHLAAAQNEPKHTQETMNGPRSEKYFPDKSSSCTPSKQLIVVHIYIYVRNHAIFFVLTVSDLESHQWDYVLVIVNSLNLEGIKWPSQVSPSQGLSHISGVSARMLKVIVLEEMASRMASAKLCRCCPVLYRP